MQKYIPVLARTRLFQGVSEDEIAAMLGCLDARLCRYRKGETVLRAGERTGSITVPVEGVLHIQRDDYWGNRSIVDRIGLGEMFGEAYLSPESGALLNDAVAQEDSTVVFLDAKRVVTVCSAACPFHARVVQNLFYAISDKNRHLIRKLGYMSRRTTREKLISYLSEEAKKQGRASFTIPFNRQELADFLSVDRSAMSNELCRMRDDGLLTFTKNRFTLMETRQGGETV